MGGAKDYGRACAVSDAVTAVLRVADGEALVLGPSPPMTAWADADDGSGVVEVYILESWGTDDLDALVDRLREVPASASRGSVEWTMPDGGVVLMFAGDTVERTVPVVWPHLRDGCAPQKLAKEP